MSPNAYGKNAVSQPNATATPTPPSPHMLRTMHVVTLYAYTHQHIQRVKQHAPHEHEYSRQVLLVRRIRTGGRVDGGESGGVKEGDTHFFQAQGHTSKDTPTHCSLLEVLSAYLRAGSSVFLGRRACCQECETSRRTFHKPAHGGCCNVQTLATDMTQGERRRISSHSGHTTPWSIPKHHGGCTPETPTLNVDFASGTT